jgi:hypothetical protein
MAESAIDNNEADLIAFGVPFTPSLDMLALRSSDAAKSF